jgi:hypothetical protein
MGRSASIDPLGIHNLGVGAADSYKIKYDDSKADSNGEKFSPKNMYVNPSDPTMCYVTALGIWLENRNETFAATKDSIFIENGEIGTASHRYCSQLVEIPKDYIDVVRQYCKPDRENSHGVCKGSATYATSGTTCPPSDIISGKVQLLLMKLIWQILKMLPCHQFLTHQDKTIATNKFLKYIAK